MKPLRWFLPATPDVLGLVRRQIAVAIEGADAFAAWAAGDRSRAETLRRAEDRGDKAKRELLEALQAAFVTPLEPEDVFALSRGIDWVLKHMSALISESEVMACAADAGIAEMAALLGEALRRIDDAIAHLGSDRDEAIHDADAAIAAIERLDAAYYEGMGALLEVEDMRERITRRELYRRCARIGETVLDVAERVVYAVMKQT